MADKKYEKYLTKNIFKPFRDTERQMVSTRHLDDFVGNNFSLDCAFITKPLLMISKPHKHKFDQYICFLSANKDDVNDFDAEIEFSLGDEHEKQVITSPTITFIPAGTAHGPLNYVRVTKPVLFLDVAITHKYERSWEAADFGEVEEGEGGDGGGGE
jgi:hypothetical protein